MHLNPLEHLQNPVGRPETQQPADPSLTEDTKRGTDILTQCPLPHHTAPPTHTPSLQKRRQETHDEAHYTTLLCLFLRVFHPRCSLNTRGNPVRPGVF